MGAGRDPPSKGLIPHSGIIPKAPSHSLPSRSVTGHQEATSSTSPLPSRVWSCKARTFHPNPRSFCGIFWWKIPLKENPTRAALCPKAFPWDAGNVRSCHSLSWTTSTFALGLKTATESEPDLFPGKQRIPQTFSSPSRFYRTRC